MESAFHGICIHIASVAAITRMANSKVADTYEIHLFAIT